MARAIDAEKFMALLKEQYLHHKSMGHNQMAKAWQGAMQLLHDMPTLTPPNEPLSIEQLREMDGEPVWVTPLGFWALVIAKPGERVKLICNDGEIVYADKEIELVGPVYRYPPEGNP